MIDAVRMVLCNVCRFQPVMIFVSGRNSNWYPPTIFPWLGGIIAAVFSVLTAVVLVGMMCGRCGTPATRAGRSAGLGSNNKVIRSKSSATIDADFFVANRRWSETSM